MKKSSLSLTALLVSALACNNKPMQREFHGTVESGNTMDCTFEVKSNPEIVTGYECKVNVPDRNKLPNGMDLRLCFMPNLSFIANYQGNRSEGIKIPNIDYIRLNCIRNDNAMQTEITFYDNSDELKVKGFQNCGYSGSPIICQSWFRLDVEEAYKKSELRVTQIK